MIHFFGNQNSKIFAVQATKELSTETISKLVWLFGDQPKIEQASIDAFFVGTRAAMISPWSTNAVEITQNMGVTGILRIEEFQSSTSDFKDFDPMISEKYSDLSQVIFTIDVQPEAIKNIEDIAAYNQQEGLALNTEEVDYLDGLAKKLGRKLYTITFVVGLVITLLSGPIVMGPTSAFIHEIAVTFNGAILVFLFFTPLQKKFN